MLQLLQLLGVCARFKSGRMDSMAASAMPSFIGTLETKKAQPQVAAENAACSVLVMTHPEAPHHTCTGLPHENWLAASCSQTHQPMPSSKLLGIFLQQS